MPGLGTVAVAVDARDPETPASFRAAATPGGRDQRDELGRLVPLGVTVLDVAPDHPWVVMADPEGNEFCALPAD